MILRIVLVLMKVDEETFRQLQSDGQKGMERVKNLFVKRLAMSSHREISNVLWRIAQSLPGYP